MTTESRRWLVLRLRRSRRKARDAAIAEALSVLGGLGTEAPLGGPFADQPGIAWITIPGECVEPAIGRLKNLGYSAAIDLVVDQRGRRKGTSRTRWKGRYIALRRVYEDPDEAIRAIAPDRRTFLLECDDGIVRAITGYRGGQGRAEHRALPVEDARLLVNLAGPERRLLDPFSGAGGIIIEAKARGLKAFSVDIERSVRFGLDALSDGHIVADARALPVADGVFDAIASEPPYHPDLHEVVVASVAEMARVTRSGGRIALLLASSQATALKTAGERAGLTLRLNTKIDRKGTAVTCFCWLRK